MDSLPQKRCAKCGETKTLTEFYKNTNRKDGLDNQCGQCRREMRASRIDSARASSRAWKKSHEAESREIQRKWRQTPNGKRYASHHNRLRRANTGRGDITPAQMFELYDRQKHCAYCNRRFTAQLLPTIDHVIPLSKGGLHTINNLVLACKSCNCRKRNN